MTSEGRVQSVGMTDRPFVVVRPIDGRPDCVRCDYCGQDYGPFETRAEAGAYAQGHRDAHAVIAPARTPS